MNTDVLTGSQTDAPIKRKRWEQREDGLFFYLIKRGKEYWVTAERRAEIMEQKRKSSRKIRAANPEKAREYSRLQHQKHRSKEKEYYQKNRERILANNKRWSLLNKEKHRNLIKNWNCKNPDKIASYLKKHRSTPERKEYQNAYHRAKRATDPLFAMSGRLRARIKVALSERGYGKDKVSKEILGCTWEHFCQHLESQFVDGMYWSNRHLWHIDHYIPIAAATDKEEVYMLNHFSNLRPLWGVDNFKKNDTLPEDFVDRWNALCQKTGNEQKMR
jgi:hypothetical protein